MHFFGAVVSMVQEPKNDSPEVDGLMKQLEEVKNKLGYALTEYKRVMDALTYAQTDNARLVGDVKTAIDCYKAMRQQGWIPGL